MDNYSIDKKRKVKITAIVIILALALVCMLEAIFRPASDGDTGNQSSSVSTKSLPASSVPGAAGLFAPASSSAPSKADLQRDATAFIRLRHNIADTGITSVQMKERLKDYMTPALLNLLFPANFNANEGLPVSSARSATQSVPLPSITSVASKTPVGNKAPAPHYVTTIDVTHLYTQLNLAAVEGKENVLAECTLKLSTDKGEKAYNWVMQFDMQCQGNKWIVTSLQRDGVSK